MRMFTRAAVALTLMAATGIAAASSPAQSQARTARDGGAAPQPHPTRNDGLRARQPLPKQPTESIVIPPDTTGRVFVKFTDEAQVRALGDGTIRALGTVDADELEMITNIVAGLGVRFERGINHSDAMLANLQARAAAMSGRAQPDLAGMVYVTGPVQRLLTAARILNDLDAVEYVQFEREYYLANGDGVARGTAGANDPFPAAPARPSEPAGGDGGGGGDEGGGGSGSGGTTGACCVIGPGGTIFCDEVTSVECVVQLGGQFQGLGTTCDTTDCTGRCCLTTGVCLDDADENSCAAAGGFFQGPALACADFPCPVAGVCCRGVFCEVTDFATCNTNDPEPGEFFPGQDCDEVSCRGACCLPDTSCVELTSQGNCEFTQGGVWGGPNTTCADVDCGEVPSLPGACCLEDDNCIDDLTDLECEEDQGGVFQGPGTACGDVMCENMCGEPAAGDCFMLPAVPNCTGLTPFCDDEACCNLICNLDPFCCDEDEGCWDVLCVLQANLACGNGDVCSSPFNETCFEPHGNTGCNNQSCCEAVCMVDEFCCSTTWDDQCVITAFQECIEDPTPGVTPDYEPLQGYLTLDPYGDIPPALVPYVPMVGAGILIGHAGEGFNMGDASQPEGDPEDPDYPNYPGLYGFGQQLLDEFGVDALGQGNLTAGRTIKIAVIEWAYWEDHEDLDVINEPGQTMIPIPFLTEPDHATACLSIINGLDNGLGVTGLAPDAQAYFFPLTSVEEGPRFLSAWTSAINTLGPGDVISASYGPGIPIGNLNCEAGMWPLLRLASDLGITVCVAAGNNCPAWNLDNSPDLGDSGATVVGACSPGEPFYRLAFSNFCTDPAIARGNIVHLKAWGELVMSAGYQVLPSSDATNPENASYTTAFNGTSAATPQIAGISACLQGLAKQFYGIPLLPEQIRLAMGAPGVPPTNPPRLFGGFAQGTTAGCPLDLDPGEGPHMIGVFPDVAGTFGSASSSILNQPPGGFDGSPFLDGYAIATGTPVFGNIFSLRASDDNYLVFESGQATAGDHPDPVGVTSIPIGILNDITYIMTAQVADLVVESHLPPEEQVSGLQVNWELQHPGNNAFLIIEMYHFGARRWIFSDFVTLDTAGLPGEDVGGTVGLGRVGGFVNENGVNFTRLWVVGTGPQAFGAEPTPGGIPFVIRWDLVDIRIGNGFGQFFDP